GAGERLGAALDLLHRATAWHAPRRPRLRAAPRARGGVLREAPPCRGCAVHLPLPLSAAGTRRAPEGGHSMTTGASESARDRWAVILAGGDGMRLSSFTRSITGDERPKQFCPVLGDSTLLEQTWWRASRLVPSSRTLTVVTRKHERFFWPLLHGLAAQHVVI